MWIRQIHRWLGIIFTLAVIVTSVAMAQEKPVIWMSFLPLPPLGLLWLTGLYLFFLPYVIQWRGVRRAAET
jgi:hypothetical protein